MRERLAMCLNTLARCYSENHDETAAHAAGRESLEICRALARTRPEKKMLLALALNNSAELAASGGSRSNSAHLEEAFGAIRESFTICALLFLSNPEMYRAKMKVILRNYEAFGAALDIKTDDVNILSIKQLL